jgi:LemA protein
MSELFDQDQGGRAEFRQAYVREQEQLAQATEQKKKKRKYATIIIVGVIVIFGLLSISSYNGLVGRKESIQSSWSQVENVMQRRADLIPNLVSTVKGITKQELEVFGRISDARSRLLQPAATPEEKVQANAQIERDLVQVLALRETYPELKSNASFLRLMDELSGSENRISVARRDYIQAVESYNVASSRFPTVIMARLFGFGRVEDYFKAAPEAQRAPQVQF